MTLPKEQLSQDSTYGKKSAEQVGNRDYDKNQQHRRHCQQDDKRSELSSYISAKGFSFTIDPL